MFNRLRAAFSYWFNLLFPKPETETLTEAVRATDDPDPPGAVKTCIEWANQMIRAADRFMDTHQLTDPLMKQCYFIYSQDLQRFECWVSVCTSGCCCKNSTESKSVLLGSIDGYPWERFWTIIHGCLRILCNNPAEKRFYQRIRITSQPDHQSLTVDKTIAHHLIQWELDSSSMNSLPHRLDPTGTETPRRHRSERSYLRRVH